MTPLPCPWCGQPPSLRESWWTFGYECIPCGVRRGDESTPEDALRVWNTRTPPPTKSAQELYVQRYREVYGTQPDITEQTHDDATWDRMRLHLDKVEDDRESELARVYREFTSLYQEATGHPWQGVGYGTHQDVSSWQDLINNVRPKAEQRRAYNAFITRAKEINGAAPPWPWDSKSTLEWIAETNLLVQP